jgi:hypothetical protein
MTNPTNRRTGAKGKVNKTNLRGIWVPIDTLQEIVNKLRRLERKLDPSNQTVSSRNGVEFLEPCE